MYILDVIPLSRGFTKDTLSYFTSIEVAPGAIVRVPLRGRTVNALVVSQKTAEESKQELKDSTYQIKKIEDVLSQDLLSAPFMAAARRAAEYHIGSMGSMLFSLVPKIVLEKAPELTTVKAPERPATRLHGLILQTDDDDRFSHYRSLVREEFARGRSVYLCMPTTSDIKRAEKLLEKGIMEYSYIFHPQTKKKDFAKRWNELTQEKHPVFIIGTGQFLCVPRHDIGTIIIERENSRAYKSISRPFTDLRLFAEYFAKETGARIIFGDSLLRTETIARYRNDEFSEITPPTLRIQSTAAQKVVDMREVDKTTVKFNPISPLLAQIIKGAKEHSERLVIFASRRGLAPITVCADCGTIVQCLRCKAPTVLHTKGGEDRYFICHRCGETRDANEKCKSCMSWRLQTLGIGSEMIANYITEQFPGFEPLRLDSDSVSTHVQAAALIKKFYETPGGILVCTEMALLYLDQKVENVAIASMDSMFSTPDFRARERNLGILIRLRNLAQKRFLIQTRHVSESVFGYAERGNLIDFYKQELQDREAFDYPPFTVLIKVSLSGEKKKVQEGMQWLAEYLTDYAVSMYPAFVPLSKGVYTMHALIKIGASRWVEKNLYEKLRALPPSFSIAVDPESVL